MRTFLRRWLGIETLERTDESPVLRKMVGEALMDALAGRSDGTQYGLSPDDARNLLHAAIESYARRLLCCTAEKVIRETIGNEKFLDELVERINRKQIHH